MGIIKPFKFGFEGRTYEFDGKMTVEEALLLHEKAHVTPLEVFSAVSRLEPKAILAFVYIVKRRKPYNEAVSFEDLMSADIYSFFELNVEPDGDDAEEQPAADPPGPAVGKIRKGGTSKTANS